MATGDMTRARPGRMVLAMALAWVLAGCGDDAAPRSADGLNVSFEDRPEPEAFATEGAARRDDPDGAAGLWAVVGGLPRPERALVENLRTGTVVVVALFRGGRAGEIRLSGEAADALDIGASPERVQITALRSEPTVRRGTDVF